VTLADLHGVGDLQARLNADRGQPRLMVIFSPHLTGLSTRRQVGAVPDLKAHPQADRRHLPSLRGSVAVPSRVGLLVVGASSRR
jgi:hypothetical protein